MKTKNNLYNRIKVKYSVIPLLYCALLTMTILLTGCDDQIMNWGKPDGRTGVTSAEIPLAVKEALANYDVIKKYAAENHPNMLVGLGVGKDIYMGEDGRHDLAAGNFQMITWGNAMKHDAVVGNTGALNFTNLDPALDALKQDDVLLYGHNFFWHTQQNQTYLKSVIKPTLVVESDSDIKNMLGGDDSDFDGGTTGSWGSWGNSSSKNVDTGYQSAYSMHLTNPSDANFWSAQCAYTFDVPLAKDVEYTIRFKAKSSSPAGQLQFQYQNSSTYGSQGGYNTFDVGTDWILCEHEFTITDYDDVNRIILNFGQVGAEYWIDDIKFGEAKDQSTAAAKRRALRRKAKSYYVIKSADEKREALLEAMENWVKGMAEHLNEKGIVPAGYDVINEAITDGDNKVRGVDGVFGGSWSDDDGTHYDSAPTEDETGGLSLNWGSGHFYWGYYVPDYAVKAFEFARQYLPADTKLFYNDYNLDTSDGKRAAAIKFVQDIDKAHGSAIVDGIGTQMHVTLSGTSDDEDNNAEKVSELRAKVDKQFKELAATGKLVRVTELDISLGTSSPSAAQYKAQSDAYKTIFESYFENVPQAQQSGITIWSLTDADDEHEYWLKGEKPNLFDASFLRKWAYKGVCDALAGEDLGLQYGGDAYKAYYENQNVSSTVE